MVDFDIGTQVSWISEIGFQLERFKKTSNNGYNFRCPYCGDSSSNKLKTRGGFYLSKGNYRFHCFNCDKNATLVEFIKDHFPNYYSKFLFESLGQIRKKQTIKVIDDIHLIKTKKLRLPYIIELPKNHKARKYLLDRKIPESYLSYFYYAEDFVDFVNNLVGYEKLIRKHTTSRIVIPFYNEEKEIIGFQGRAIGNHSQRYITVMLQNKLKVFGLDRIDFDKLIYIVEGPFDSLFLDNSIAICGSNLNSVNFDNSVYIFDNEPDNKIIVTKMKNIIEKYKKIVIWPSNIKQKDINDMILENLNVMDIIKSNTYSGLLAKIKYYEFLKNF